MKKTKVGKLVDQKALLMKELAEGIELAKQLRIRTLNSTNSSHTCLRDDQALNYSLVDKMLSSFDKSISLAKLFNFDNGVPQVDHSNSPECSLGINSPSNEVSSQDFRMSKTRKKMPPRIEMIRVSPNKTVCGLEGPLNDGLTWRKYGQKDILGAKFPRSYYRCTHRYTQSCVATKQVQKSDDPNIYQVIYKGEHTCIPGAHLAQAHNKPNPTRIETELQPQPKSLPSPQQECQTAQSNQEETTLGLGPKVEVEPIEKENVAQIFRSFSFKSAQFEPGFVDEYMVSSSPGFWLPATSESDCFPDSACRITAFGIGMNVQTSESGLNESISGPSSVGNSPNVGDFEFHFDMLPDIDSNFSFDLDPLSYRI